jgi:hypothetical protein
MFAYLSCVRLNVKHGFAALCVKRYQIFIQNRENYFATRINCKIRILLQQLIFFSLISHSFFFFFLLLSFSFFFPSFAYVSVSPSLPLGSVARVGSCCLVIFCRFFSSLISHLHSLSCALSHALLLSSSLTQFLF